MNLSGCRSVILLLWYLLMVGESFYAQHYRRCQLGVLKGTQLSLLEIERVPKMRRQYQITPRHHYKKSLEYLENGTMVYHSYIAAGASGEVYLIELEEHDMKTHTIVKTQPKVAKRFFENRMEEFEEQNYIMNKLGYGINWMKEENDQDNIIEQDSIPHQKYSTLALYPYHTSLSWRDALPQQYDVPVLVYKICKDLEKAHRNAIIHNDIKLGNTLVIAPENGVKQLFDAQLIDWNLATFYYYGYTSHLKKGTLCYYSPQQLFRTSFVTPQTDVYSLGVAIFYYITDKKPFTTKCSRKNNNNIESIFTLAGIVGMGQTIHKYRYFMDESMREALHNVKKKPQKYKGVTLESLIPKQHQKYFDDDLIDLLEGMLHQDPQKRLTMKQVLKSDYFDKVRRLPPMYYQKNKEKGLDVKLPSKKHHKRPIKKQLEKYQISDEEQVNQPAANIQPATNTQQIPNPQPAINTQPIPNPTTNTQQTSNPQPTTNIQPPANTQPAANPQLPTIIQPDNTKQSINPQPVTLIQPNNGQLKLISNNQKQQPTKIQQPINNKITTNNNQTPKKNDQQVKDNNQRKIEQINKLQIKQNNNKIESIITKTFEAQNQQNKPQVKQQPNNMNNINIIQPIINLQQQKIQQKVQNQQQQKPKLNVQSNEQQKIQSSNIKEQNNVPKSQQKADKINPQIPQLKKQASPNLAKQN